VHPHKRPLIWTYLAVEVLSVANSLAKLPILSNTLFYPALEFCPAPCSILHLSFVQHLVLSCTWVLSNTLFYPALEFCPAPCFILHLSFVQHLVLSDTSEWSKFCQITRSLSVSLTAHDISCVCMCMHAFSGVWISQLTRDSGVNSAYQNFHLPVFVHLSIEWEETYKLTQLIQNSQCSKFDSSGLHCASLASWTSTLHVYTNSSNPVNAHIHRRCMFDLSFRIWLGTCKSSPWLKAPQYV
jgi:hypothetical protein